MQTISTTKKDEQPNTSTNVRREGGDVVREEAEEANWADVAGRCQTIVSLIRAHVAAGMAEGEHRRERRVARLLCDLGIIRPWGDEGEEIGDNATSSGTVAAEKEAEIANVAASSSTAAPTDTTASSDDANQKNSHEQKDAPNNSSKWRSKLYLDAMMTHALRWCPFEVAAALLFVAGKTVLEGSSSSSSSSSDSAPKSASSPSHLQQQQQQLPFPEVYPAFYQPLIRSVAAEAIAGLVRFETNEEGTTTFTSAAATDQISVASRVAQFVSLTERRICRNIFGILFLGGLDDPLSQQEKEGGDDFLLLFSHLPRLSTYAAIGALYPLLITRDDTATAAMAAMAAPSQKREEEGNKNNNGKSEEIGEGTYDENRSQNTIAESLLQPRQGSESLSSSHDFSFLRPLLSSGLTALVRDRNDGLLALIRVLLFDDRVSSAFTLDAVQHLTRLVASPTCGGGSEKAFRKIVAQIAAIMKSYYSGKEEEDGEAKEEGGDGTSSSSTNGLTVTNAQNSADDYLPKIVREAASRVQKKTLFGAGGAAAGGLSDETLEERLHMALVSILEAMARLTNITPNPTQQPVTTTAQNTAPLSGFVLLNRCFLGPLFAPLTLRRATTNNTSESAEERGAKGIINANANDDEVVGALRALWAVAHGSSLIMTTATAAATGGGGASRRIVCVVWGVVARGVLAAYATLKQFESAENSKRRRLLINSNNNEKSRPAQPTKRSPLIQIIGESSSDGGGLPSSEKAVADSSSPQPRATSPSSSHSFALLAQMTSLIERTFDALLVTAHTGALSLFAEELLLVAVGAVEASSAIDGGGNSPFVWSIVGHSSTAARLVAVPFTPSSYAAMAEKYKSNVRGGDNDVTTEADDWAGRRRSPIKLSGQRNANWNELAANAYDTSNKSMQRAHDDEREALRDSSEGDASADEYASVGESLVAFLRSYGGSNLGSALVAPSRHSQQQQASLLNFSAAFFSKGTTPATFAKRPNAFIHRLFVAVVEAMAAQHALLSIRQEEEGRNGGSTANVTSPSSSSLLQGSIPSPLALVGVSLISNFDVSVLMGTTNHHIGGANQSFSSPQPTAATMGREGVEKSVTLMLKFISLLCKMDDDMGGVASVGGGLIGEKGSSPSFLTLLVATALPQLLATIAEMLDIVILEPKTIEMLTMSSAAADGSNSSSTTTAAKKRSLIEEISSAATSLLQENSIVDGGATNTNTSSSVASIVRSLGPKTIAKVNGQIMCLGDLRREAEELLARFDSSAALAAVDTTTAANNNNGSDASVSSMSVQAAVTSAIEAFLAQLAKLRERLPEDEVIDAEADAEEGEGENDTEGVKNGGGDDATEDDNEEEGNEETEETLSDLKKTFVRLSRAYNDASQALMARSAAALAVNMRHLLGLVKELGGEGFRGVDSAVATAAITPPSSTPSPSSSVAKPSSSSSALTSSVHLNKKKMGDRDLKKKAATMNRRVIPVIPSHALPQRDAVAYGKMLKQTACLALRALIAVHDGTVSAGNSAASSSAARGVVMGGIGGAGANDSQQQTVSSGGATCSTDLFVQVAAVQLLAYLTVCRLDGQRGEWVASVIKKGLLMAVPLPPSPPTTHVAAVGGKLPTAAGVPPPASASVLRPNMYAGIAPKVPMPTIGSCAASPSAAAVAADFPIAVPSGPQSNAMALLLLEVLSAIFDVDEKSSASSDAAGGSGGWGLTAKLFDTVAPFGTTPNASTTAGNGSGKGNSPKPISLFEVLVLVATANPPPQLQTQKQKPVGAATSTGANLLSACLYQQQQQPNDRRLTVASLQLLGRAFVALHPRVPLGTLLGVCTDVFRSPTVPMMGRAAASAAVTYVSIYMLLVGLGGGGGDGESDSAGNVGGGAYRRLPQSSGSGINKSSSNSGNANKEPLSSLLYGSGGGASSSSAAPGDDLVELARFARHLASFTMAAAPTTTKTTSASSSSPSSSSVGNNAPPNTAFDDPDVAHADVIRSHGELILKALDAFRAHLSERAAAGGGQQSQLMGGAGGVKGLAADVELLRRMEAAEAEAEKAEGGGHEKRKEGEEGLSSSSTALSPSNTNGNSTHVGSSAGALRAAAQQLLSNARVRARADLSSLSAFTHDLQRMGSADGQPAASSSSSSPSGGRNIGLSSMLNIVGRPAHGKE